MNATHMPIFHFDDFEADTRSRELYRGGTRIKVYGQPFEILIALLERPGHVVTREELRQRLWPLNTFVDFERVLNTSVMRLRQALGDSASSPRYIETLPRVGYRFLAQVVANDSFSSRPVLTTVAINPPEVAEQSEGVEESAPPAVAAEELAESHDLIRVGLWGAAVMVAVVFAGFALGQWRRWERERPSYQSVSGQAAIKPRPSIAILGFKNLSGRPEEAWLSTAFSEMLTTEMGAGETLRVIPTQQIAALKSGRSLPDSDQYDQELLQRVRLDSGADVIVLGSYTALGKEWGGQVRLDVHVQDTNSGEIRAQLSQTGTEVKLLPMVAKLGAELRTKLGVAAVADEGATTMSSSLPESPEAARLYSEGLAELRGFHAREARDSLARSVAIEPKFAIGHSALSAAFMVLGYDDKAREEAWKAVELSAGLSREERLLVEERYREQNKEWAKAAQIAGALHTFFPDRVDYGIWAARMETLAGNPADALETLRSLKQLPPPAPNDPLISMTEAEALQELGNPSAALEAIQQAQVKCKAMNAVALEPNLLLEKGNILGTAGELREAASSFEQAQQLFGALSDPNGAARALSHRAAISARQQRYEEAHRMYDRALATFRASGNTTAVAETLEDMAAVLQKKGDSRGAQVAREELVSLNLRSNGMLTASRQRVLP
jgi:DNA-binding winged helix-turn-helix (wHTH) protein/tetratricopeptide (TPR) repeat protein/TolB-like protein